MKKILTILVSFMLLFSSSPAVFGLGEGYGDGMYHSSTTISRYEVGSASVDEELVQLIAAELEKAYGVEGDVSSLAAYAVPVYTQQVIPHNMAVIQQEYAKCVLRNALGIPLVPLPNAVYQEIGVALKLKRWGYAATKIVQVMAPLVAKGVVRSLGGPVTIAASLVWAVGTCL